MIISYTGAPNLALTVAVVKAGGGASNFSAARLVGVLAGPLAPAEVKKLTAQFGAQRVQSFLTTFTYAVDDAVHIATKAHVALPSQPKPSPTNGKALAAALYHAGTNSDGIFDVGFMLERMVSHPIHMQVMRDIDGRKEYGKAVDASFHVILTQAMYDLRSAYKL